VAVPRYVDGVVRIVFIHLLIRVLTYLSSRFYPLGIALRYRNSGTKIASRTLSLCHAAGST
jgi:hypothetical protein